MTFDRKEYNKKYYSYHKKERKQYNNVNQEKIKKQTKQYRDTHQEEIKQYDKKRIRFKGKQIRLDHNPKTGTCTKCHRSVNSGEIKLTNMHHEKYDESHPIAYTIELCVSCHMKREAQLREKRKIEVYCS